MLLDFDVLESVRSQCEANGQRVRALVYTNPHNPTGHSVLRFAV